MLATQTFDSLVRFEGALVVSVARRRLQQRLQHPEESWCTMKS